MQKGILKKMKNNNINITKLKQWFLKKFLTTAGVITTITTLISLGAGVGIWITDKIADMKAVALRQEHNNQLAKQSQEFYRIEKELNQKINVLNQTINDKNDTIDDLREEIETLKKRQKNGKDK